MAPSRQQQSSTLGENDQNGAAQKKKKTVSGLQAPSAYQPQKCSVFGKHAEGITLVSYNFSH
jgi:hypothetical protein